MSSPGSSHSNALLHTSQCTREQPGTRTATAQFCKCLVQSQCICILKTKGLNISTWDLILTKDTSISPNLRPKCRITHPCPGQADGWWWHGFINRLVFHFKAPQKAEILRPDMESLSTNLLAKWYIPIKILGDYKMSGDHQTTWPRPLKRIRTFLPQSFLFRQ